MSLLQIDTISIVIRSPYLVLFSRLENYPARWLDEPLARGELMEYWIHETCSMPRNDSHLIRHRMLAPERMGWKYKDAWMQEHTAEITQLTQHVHDKGSVRSADFGHPCKGANGWWEWKPHKRHLEGLFIVGKVTVIKWHNFQCVYGLTHRVMPERNNECDLVSQTEAEIITLDNSARSLGMFREQRLANYYRLKRPTLAAWHEARAEQQQVIVVHVEELGNLWPYADLLPLLRRVFAGKPTATYNVVLSPSDPVVWDRRRAEQPFGFSRRLECYIPVSKRQYGYFALPLLHRGQLARRIGAKMYRQTSTLGVTSLWLQEGIRPTTTLQKGLHQAITDFVSWQRATWVILGRYPQGLLADCRAGWRIDPVA